MQAALRTTGFSSIVAKSGLLLLLLALLSLGFLSARWLQAETLAFGVQQQLDQWNELGPRIELEAWQHTLADSEQALHFNPLRAEYLQLQGQVQARRRYAPWLDEETEVTDLNALFAAPRQARQQTLAAYRRAAHARPAWPFGWLELAAHKAAAKEMDDEFAFAVAQALRHGKHISEVQQPLAQLTMSYRDQVLADAALKLLMLTNLQTALSPSAPASENILALLRSNAGLGTFCPLLDQAALASSAQEACTAQ